MATGNLAMTRWARPVGASVPLLREVPFLGHKILYDLRKVPVWTLLDAMWGSRP